MFEKREHERSAIELAASYGIGEDSQVQAGAQISNISLGGLCLSTDKNLSVDEKIQLSIELDSHKDALLLAKVAWIKKNDSGGFTVGVQIIERSGKDYDRFIEFYNTQV